MGREVLPPGRPTSAEDDLVADRFRLERSLGNGGMGEVFVATDTVLDRQVALKRLSPQLADDDAARARFLREARALARINSPNVVGVFDAGGDRDPYLVMELIGGTTLRNELRKDRRIEPERAARIAAGVAAGLAAAHAQGVVHRDVKPSNIFLTASGVPKVGDFGIARIERGDVTLTMTGQAFGSPAYIAPEQATGGTVDARADLYSLGCVLYEMLAGRRPFEGTDAMALTYQHVHTSPVRLDALDAQVSPQLASLVDALLQKDPADRPRSADDVRQVLESIPATAPTTAELADPEHTTVLPHRAASLKGRRRPPWWLFAAAAAVVILAALALANALGGGDAPARAGGSPSTHASSAPPSTAPPTSSVSTPPATPEEAGAALISLARSMEAAGAIDAPTADEIEHTVADVLGHGDGPVNGDKNGQGNGHGHGTDALNELKAHIAEKVDGGLISASDAAQLDAAIDALARTLPAGDGEGD